MGLGSAKDEELADNKARQVLVQAERLLLGQKPAPWSARSEALARMVTTSEEMVMAIPRVT